MACTFYRHATDIRLQRCASIDQVWKRRHACVQKYFSAVKRSILTGSIPAEWSNFLSALQPLADVKLV